MPSGNEYVSVATLPTKKKITKKKKKNTQKKITQKKKIYINYSKKKILNKKKYYSKKKIYILLKKNIYITNSSTTWEESTYFDRVAGTVIDEEKLSVGGRASGPVTAGGDEPLQLELAPTLYNGKGRGETCET